MERSRGWRNAGPRRKLMVFCLTCAMLLPIQFVDGDDAAAVGVGGAAGVLPFIGLDEGLALASGTSRACSSPPP